MIVVDASVVLDLLLRTPDAGPLAERLLGSQESLNAPHLLDVEVLQVLRRYEARGELRTTRGRAALDLLAVFPVTRHPHVPFAARIWELRRNLTAHDAAYVALAEGLDATLLTRDRRLARAPGHTARVEVV